MARLTPKFEKHGYLIGELTLQSASTPFQPLKTMYFKGGRVTLDQPPEGGGVTTVKLIRNFDPDDVIYQTSLVNGQTTANLNSEATLSAGDYMSLTVTSLANDFAGADLILSLEYHN